MGFSSARILSEQTLIESLMPVLFSAAGVTFRVLVQVGSKTVELNPLVRQFNEYTVSFPPVPRRSQSSNSEIIAFPNAIAWP